MPFPKLCDASGNPVTYLRLSVTDRCNLRCFYCVPEEGICQSTQEELLRTEEIIRLLRIANLCGVNKVRLTGGEPLARRGIGRMVREIGKIGFRDIAMTTNGVLLHKFAPLLREAGLHRVNLSLDSLRPDRFHRITGRDYYDAVLKGLAAARNAQLTPIKINAVIVRGVNDDEICDFVQMSAEQDDIEVRFIEYMPIGVGQGYRDEKLVSVAEMLGRVKERYEVEALTPDDPGAPARMYRVLGGKGKFGFISPMTQHFCNDCNRLRITSDGKIKTCLFSRSEYDLLPWLRGNHSDREIAEYLCQSVAQKASEIDDKYSSSRNMTRIGG